MKLSVCSKCEGRRAEPGYARCAECALYDRRYQARRRAVMRAAGLCVGCKRKARDGGSWCVACCARYHRPRKEGT